MTHYKYHYWALFLQEKYLIIRANDNAIQCEITNHAFTRARQHVRRYFHQWERTYCLRIRLRCIFQDYALLLMRWIFIIIDALQLKKTNNVLMQGKLISHPQFYCVDFCHSDLLSFVWPLSYFNLVPLIFLPTRLTFRPQQVECYLKHIHHLTSFDYRYSN